MMAALYSFAGAGRAEGALARAVVLSKYVLNTAVAVLPNGAMIMLLAD